MFKIIQKYNNCRRCNLHTTRRNIVFGRGSHKADIIFIGEGPGKSEDLIGLPFIGRSGKLLDETIKRAKELSRIPDTIFIDYYITNIVCCHPTNRFSGENRPPTKEEAYACYPRLLEQIEYINPKCVITLGKIPADFCKELPYLQFNLYHPAFILRTGGTCSKYYQEYIRKLINIFERIILK